MKVNNAEGIHIGSICMLSLSGGSEWEIPSLKLFSGENGQLFSQWLKRFNDYAENQNPVWTPEVKAKRIKLYLADNVRERYEELTDKSNFDRVVQQLSEIYENPLSRSIAKQNLTKCKQLPREPVAEFLERLRKIVRLATIGKSDADFRARLLEEFLDRLDLEVGFHVKASKPRTLEEAVENAVHIEGLLEAKAQAEQDEFERTERGIMRIARHDNDSNIGSSRVLCFYCQSPGHIERNCFKKRVERQISDETMPGNSA